MRKQVLLFAYGGYWSDVIQETNRSCFAIDVDGVTVCVVKDGTEQLRVTL